MSELKPLDCTVTKCGELLEEGDDRLVEEPIARIRGRGILGRSDPCDSHQPGRRIENDVSVTDSETFEPAELDRVHRGHKDLRGFG